MLDLVPAARVAHIGLYREPETFTAVEYFFKAPSDLAERLVIVVAPGARHRRTRPRPRSTGSRSAAPRTSASSAMLAAPQGIERLRGLHPDVPIWTAAIDDGLDDNGFILPGLGDAGDRAYGTK